jgi:hypothetical protein
MAVPLESSGGMVPVLWCELSVLIVASRDVTSVSRDAEASRRSGIRRARRSVISERAVFAAVSALARIPVSCAVKRLFWHAVSAMASFAVWIVASVLITICSRSSRCFQWLSIC